MTDTLDVTPIYGWGWFMDEPTSTPEVPAPFTIRAASSDERVWEGAVTTPGHPFEGHQVLLSKRHVAWDGHVNVKVREGPSGRVLASGFAVVAM
ncbi:hypothetical protein [uncultured Brevundimonas sp.]|uniref:hypothetical protein n=1 Tax=uncultured Brevundimonas sp. TaxID=213418 RepID=UPI0030EB87FC